MWHPDLTFIIPPLSLLLSLDAPASPNVTELDSAVRTLRFIILQYTAFVEILFG